jgi:hypothetical protein
MEYSLLDTVVLNRDLPEHGLKFGDLGVRLSRSISLMALRLNSSRLRVAPARCSRSTLAMSDNFE